MQIIGRKRRRSAWVSGRASLAEARAVWIGGAINSSRKTGKQRIVFEWCLRIAVSGI